MHPKTVVRGAADHPQEWRVLEMPEPFIKATFEVEPSVRAATTASNGGLELKEEAIVYPADRSR